MIDKEIYETLKKMMELSKILSDGEIEEYYDHPLYERYPERKPKNLPTLMQLILFNHKIIDKISILMYNVNGDEK